MINLMSKIRKSLENDTFLKSKKEFFEKYYFKNLKIMKNELIPITFLQTPTDNSSSINRLKKFWQKVYPIILNREKHFKNVWANASEEEIFAELIFCLFTPQSKAVTCWTAVNELANKNMFFNATATEIAQTITAVRFRNNKANYMIKARKLFTINNKIKIKEKLTSFKNIHEARLWLVKNVKGIGYKEAGHFLRNVGIGKNLAILDRHILKNLKTYGAINEIPKTLTKKTYLEIEKQMQNFSNKIGIPMGHLDMLFWCKNTGGIFK